MLKNIFPNFFLVFLLFFGNSIQDNNEDKYFFQLYPSIDSNNPHFLYLQNYEKLLTINATEGDNCKIINENSINEFTYKNISSIIIVNDTYLVKTCFINNKLVEISYDNNRFLYSKNIDNIKYCYSSQILNPNNDSFSKDKYVIITYFTELLSDGKYTHKAILFYPFTHSFSDEYTLLSDTSFIVNDFYPENCVTFRDTDIYCSIHFTGHTLVDFNLLGNNYVIETNNLFSEKENIFLVISNTITSTTNYFKKIIPLNREESTYIITKFKNGMKDIYLTECHNQKDAIKTWLRYSYYIRETHLSYIKIDQDYGLKISDKAINPNLLNYIAPNQEEMLIIYLNPGAEKTNLLISRINTKDIVYNYMGYAFNNYYRTDICLEPKYMQSTYINSFINYEEKDKEYMRNNPYNTYYKYEKDIGIVISCKENEEIKYQTMKVEIPQCLNYLDEINSNNIHNLKFTNDKNEIIFDIFNDPNLISFRNTSIYFNSSVLFALLVTMKIKEKGESEYYPIQYDKEYNNITHIKFVRNKDISYEEPFKLPYTIQNRGLLKNNIVNAMKSDSCFLEFSIDDDEIVPITCSVDFCLLCESESICKICTEEIEGVFLDEYNKSDTFGKCICDNTKGFKKSPKLFNMCICEDGYSFYNGKDICNKTEELENGPYYIDDIEPKSNISIYKDCPIGCKECTKNEKDELICSKCLDNYLLKDYNCLQKEYQTGEWFKLGNYVFNYLKIDNCIFIFEGKNLFLISDKESCVPLMDISNYNYISNCLNNEINLTNFIDIENVNIYNSSSEGIIAEKYSEDNIIHFYLVKYNSDNYKNLSSFKIKSKNEEKISEDYLIFKADIKRNDTISMQVEYQLYNLDKNKINERIKLTEDKYELNIYLPMSWKEGQIDKINELSEKNISIFNSSSPFYLDVCYKFTTSNNEDMFLEDRKNKYYINESFCENGCQFLEYNKEIEKVICKCKFKENTDNYNSVTFGYNKVDDRFNKNITCPNLAVMKCTSVVRKSLRNNVGFFLTLFLLFAFVGFFVYRIIKGEQKVYDYLNKIRTGSFEDKKSEDGSEHGSEKGSEQGKPESDRDSLNPNKNNNMNNNNQGDNQKEINIPYYSDINIGKKRGIKNTPNINNNPENNLHLITGNSETKKDDKGNTGNMPNMNDNNPINNELISNSIENQTKNENNINNINNTNTSINEKNKNENGNNEDKKSQGNSEINIDINKKSITNCQNENLSKSISKIRESIPNDNSLRRSIKSETYVERSSYSRDRKEKFGIFIEENKNEEELKMDEININEELNEKEENKVVDTFFNEEAEKEINSPFKQRNVHVGTMLVKDDTKKKHKHKGNPPDKKDKSEVIGSRETFTSSENKEKEIVIDDYILDKMKYQDIKELKNRDERNILKIWLSIIKNNSTIYLVIRKKNKIEYEDIFIKASLIILFISLYLCLNTFLLYKMSMVKLYTGSCTFGNFILNIFITSFIVSVIMIIIKKYMTLKDFLYDLSLKAEKIHKKKSNQIQNASINSDGEHKLTTQNIRYNKKMVWRIRIFGLISILFLIFNCILVTSFCGVFSNSDDELFLNTFMSILLSTIIRAIFFLIGAILRFFSLKKDSEIMYNISRLFNPLYFSYEDLKNMILSGICKKAPNKGDGNLKVSPEEP